MTGSIGQAARVPNPALAQLAWLLGEWQTSGTHPMLPGRRLRGRARFEWHEGGAFLALRTEMADPEVPAAIALVGSDDGEERLCMLYFDERGVSRHLDVTAGDGVIVWRRDFPAFRQSWTLRRIADHKLEGRGRMARDGGPWEDDLALDYARVAE